MAKDLSASLTASSGGGAIESVNTLTGAVSLGVEDLDDYQAQPGTHPVAYHSDKQLDGNWSAVKASTLGAYCFEPVSGNYTGITINKFDATSGTSLDTQGFVGGTTLDLWVSADNVNFTQHTATNSYTQGSKNALFTGFSPDLSAYTSASALYFSISAPGAPAPLADGDILQYESATSKFRPVQLGVDDLSDVDTSTVAPTDGQAILWDNTAQKWEPGSLGVEDLDDFALNPNSSSITWGTYNSSGDGVIDGVNYVASNTPSPGKWHANTNFLYVNRRSEGSLDRTDQLKALAVGDSVTVTDSVGYSVTETLTTVSFDLVADGGTYDRVLLKFNNYSTWNSTVNKTGSITIAAAEFASGNAPLADGDILKYNSTDSKFKPAGATGVRSLLGIEEYATDAAAGTGGLSTGELYYNTTSSSYVLKT